MIAIVISLGVTMLYLAFRFEWRFGVAAIIATAHDLLSTLAFLAIMRLEVSLTVVAALLTVIGYSLNDTIIIFDRVRENLKKQREESLYDVLNRSINETLPRSILTHVTVAAATLSLLLFAGEVIRPFSWIMLFGIVHRYVQLDLHRRPGAALDRASLAAHVGDREQGTVARSARRGTAARDTRAPRSVRADARRTTCS